MPDFYLLIAIWYRQNSRELPWRDTRDPYKIWLSEIIMQQTRVDQGLQYYIKFVQTYPTIKHLAMASEQDVLNNWQGLGYYSRARNLHSTAIHISNECNGVFPKTYEGIKQLKGVGAYTAAAISSFAYNLPHAVVDGNVYRFLSRLFNIEIAIDSSAGQKTFQTLADSLLSTENPGNHNQAIMEFGALVCKPKNPLCNECPFNDRCMALEKGLIADRPVKRGKIKIRERTLHYFVQVSSDYIYIDKRTGNDIWKHMFQFPMIESKEPDANIDLGGLKTEDSMTIKHILSHQRLNVIFHRVTALPAEINTSKMSRINVKDIGEYPLPRVIDRYLESHPI